ncbi:hypothetical protein CBOM_03685 [Ceraceosorus bombacis]|uniref:DUF7719 domain-containing protein n=1 Tax=Ceraceosorus bombacis TaxID=401625 RepID=A0A0P1BIB6_9BASI|nr:hypothetical protein CBOM_03685 [Ceraceosorus bombacis]
MPFTTTQQSNAWTASELEDFSSEDDYGSDSSYEKGQEEEEEEEEARFEELGDEALSGRGTNVEVLSPEELQARGKELMDRHQALADGNGIPTPINTVLDLLIWCMPFTFLYLLLDIMIQQQYAMHPTFLIELGRLLGTAPILAVFIYYTAIRRVRTTLQARLLEAFITLLSLASGVAFLWVYAKAPYTQSTRQLPPLGTIWVFTIVRLPLPHALAALAIVAGWTRYAGVWDAIAMK